jgi:Flp pilus assembly protein TadB
MVFVVSGLILLAGGSWLFSQWWDRRLVRQKTGAAFVDPDERSRSPTSLTPMSRFHPYYAQWLRQIGSKRTAKALENQQWMFAFGGLAVGWMVTQQWFFTLIVTLAGFIYPVLQVRIAVQRVKREIAQEIRKVILLLIIYVEAGKSNIHAVQLATPHTNGRAHELLRDATQLMHTMSFEKVMKQLIEESPSDELEMTAKALHLSAKHGTELAYHLRQTIEQINHNDRLNLTKYREGQKRAVYMKFMLFFVTPLILDVGFYMWSMFTGAFKAF